MLDEVNKQPEPPSVLGAKTSGNQVRALQNEQIGDRLDRKVGEQLDELRDWSLSHVKLDAKLHKEVSDVMEKVYQRDVFSEAEVRQPASQPASQPLPIHLRNKGEAVTLLRSRACVWSIYAASFLIGSEATWADWWWVVWLSCSPAWIQKMRI